MIRTALYRFLRSIFVRLLEFVPLDDPWERWNQRIPHWAYSRMGSRNEFHWYFEGESTVQVSSIAEVCAWLQTCAYVSDQELFGQTDFWQHPTDFERLRRGDCDDHALWAWRKLTELGLAAELVVGRRRGPTGAWAGHAWVQYHVDGVEYVLETAEKDEAVMIQPLSSVRHLLRPHFAVRGDLTQAAFEGFMHSMRDDGRQERQAKRGGLVA